MKKTTTSRTNTENNKQKLPDSVTVFFMEYWPLLHTFFVFNVPIILDKKESGANTLYYNYYYLQGSHTSFRFFLFNFKPTLTKHKMNMTFKKLSY